MLYFGYFIYTYIYLLSMENLVILVKIVNYNEYIFLDLLILFSIYGKFSDFSENCEL